MAISLQIDVFSDLVCPWCYIGKQRFSVAAERLARPDDGSEPIELDVHLRAFQLDPTADPESTEPVINAYAKKFGGLTAAQEILDRVTQTAAADGLEFHMDRAQRANTLRAHRLNWWAGQPGSGIDPLEMNSATMRAYFTDGKNIGDIATLADLAAELGADRAAVTDMLWSGEGVEAVAADLAAAADTGVTAVPTFVVNEQWAIPGAQDADTLVSLLRRTAEAQAGSPDA